MNKEDDNQNHEITTFIQIANDEYDALSKYCNAMASLSHSITSYYGGDHSRTISTNPTNRLSSSSLQFKVTSHQKNIMNRKHLYNVELEKSLSLYQTSLLELQSVHFKLVQEFQRTLTTAAATANNNDNLVMEGNHHHHPNTNIYSTTDTSSSQQIFKTIPSLHEILKEHIQLSERVIKTCSSSSCNSIGYGPLHPNGILKDINGTNGQNHEIRLVSLVSLRASISRMERLVVVKSSDSKKKITSI